MKLTESGALKIAEAVNNQEETACAVLKEANRHLQEKEAEHKIFSCLAGEAALEQAAAVDQKIKEGFSLPLAGAPLVISDDYAYQGLPLSLNSEALKNYYPPFSATVLEKLTGAGAVVVGKTQAGDMGLDWVSKEEAARSFFTAPLQLARSGAAAAAQSFFLVLEKDSGGISRQAAAKNKVYSLRPTPGRVSRFGLSLNSPSFDYPAFLAADLSALKVFFKTAAGYDERDSMSALSLTVSDQSAATGDQKAPVIGYSSALYTLLEQEVAAVYEEGLNQCQNNNLKTKDLPLGDITTALQAFYVIAFCETSSNLNRFDGIRFGVAAESDNLDDYYFNTRRLTFGAEACRRSIFGTYLLSGDNYQRYYLQALKVVNHTRAYFAELFKKCDLLLLPLFKSFQPPPESDFIAHYEEEIFTAPINLAGLPSLALPRGLQLAASPFGEENIFAAARLLWPGKELQEGPGGGGL